MQELDDLTAPSGELRVKDEGPYRLRVPELSDWRCHMFGMGPYCIAFRPAKGNVPNFFWRFMQRLCFGHQWVKDNKND